MVVALQLPSSSLVTGVVEGRTLEQALEIKNADIAKELELPPAKIHCSIVAEEAIAKLWKIISKNSDDKRLLYYLIKRYVQRVLLSKQRLVIIF